MAAPTISIYVDSPEESFGETIEIGVDVTHPVPEEVRALRDRADIAEVEGATLYATIRTMGVVERSHRNRMRNERHTRIEVERQLALVQVELTKSRISHSQDREDFKKLKDFMTSSDITHR
ncbi:hypothetical protein Tco_0442950 [Tanacetum coccineum]